MRTAYLTRPAGALLALACAAAAGRSAVAQDTVATARHTLALDLTRVRPFMRSYDMVVYASDSAHVIGQRDVTFAAGTYAGQPVWLLVERRTGLVPAVDSLFLATDMRPIHWSSDLGRSRLAMAFPGDSMFGAVVTPAARRSMILGSRPDLLVSTAMIEALVPLLALTSSWSDSAAVLAVDAGDATVVPAELAIVGSAGDSAHGSWLMSVRTDRGQLQLWIDKATGAVTQVEQTLPEHVGSRLEFRPRPAPPTGVPLPP